VNVSPVQFRGEGLNETEWIACLEQLGLPGSAIVVELTERMLIDASKVTSDKLLAFRDAGIQVALDDFGTGYSSLAYLRKMDIDFLKIDQSFVRNLSALSEDLVLCEAIVVMAHKLGLKVIAEGVETVEQRDLLAAIGCDFGQGYLFSRPIPADDFTALLHSGLPAKESANGN
jgi:EAL domain-containing protein (putative c-di-GMP-specific phosphodiesterase class I)